MKLLILTQYFPPEVGAPQNRLYELALRLKAAGVHVTVLTAMPNYPQMKIYSGYENKTYMYEDMNGLKVHRASIFIPSTKSIISRLRNYFSFVMSSKRVGVKYLDSSYDFLMCESPPLFLGYSAMYLAKKKKAKLIFNVSDLWPESAEKLGVVTSRRLLNMAYKLEEKLYRKSVLVTGQTQGICKNIEKRFPSVKTYWLPNGVDISYFNPTEIAAKGWREKQGFTENDFICLYAGILGLSQGVEVILHAAQLLKENTLIKFVLLGSGPEKEKLIALRKQLNLENVFIIDGVSKEEMRFVLKEVNTAIIPLRKLDLFLGAIPSKIFENLSMKIPVILGVDGEARELFVNQGKCALYVEPENSKSYAEMILKLYQDEALCKQLANAGREYVSSHFNRNTIASKFHEQLKKL